MHSYIKAVLEWNKKLFPILAILLVTLVILKSIFPNTSSRILNLDYKVIFIIISGILYLVQYYVEKYP
jgi:hypothetical protein